MQAEAALPQNTGADLRKQSTLPSVIKGQSQSQAGRSQLSKEVSYIKLHNGDSFACIFI